MLLLPYLLPLDAMLDGVRGVSGTSRRSGEDVICCDTEDDGCGLRMWLNLFVEGIPTDIILAAAGAELGGLGGGSVLWLDSNVSTAVCCV